MNSRRLGPSSVFPPLVVSAVIAVAFKGAPLAAQQVIELPPEDRLLIANSPRCIA